MYEIEMKSWNTVVPTSKIETIETMCSGASVNDVERERERQRRASNVIFDLFERLFNGLTN